MTNEDPPRRIWILRVAAYAIFVCGLAAVIAPRATSIIDGNSYFEMARQMAMAGSYEVPNGLDVVRSDELWLGNTVLMDDRLVSKYPPLYALLAAPFYRLLGLPGLIAMNVLSLGLIMLAFFLLARRLLPTPFAFYCTLALPFATPLFLYAVIVMPHLVSAALVLWAVTLGCAALDARSPRAALGWGVATGVLCGLAMGIRVQDLIPTGVLTYVLIRRAVLPRYAVGGLVAGLVPWIVTMAFINAHRFGSYNPISYGPKGYKGSPIDLETSSFLLHTPSYFVLFGLGAALLLLYHFTSPPRLSRATARLWRWPALAAAVLCCALVPGLRNSVAHLAGSATALVVDASVLVYGFAKPVTFHGLIYKSLLQASPVLCLGLGAAAWYSLRAKDPLLHALGLMSVLIIGFLATRHLQVRELGNVLGIAAYGTRYLVEFYAVLFLLSAHVVCRLKMKPRHIIGGAALGGALFWLLAWSEPGINSYGKRLAILYGSLVLSAGIGVALVLWRRLAHRALLTVLLVAALLYSAGITVTQDTRRVVTIMQLHSGWAQRMDRVLPRRMVLVGWYAAMHGIYPIREGRQVIMVDAHHDKGRGLMKVLRAFDRRGLPIYYFGLGLDRVRSRVEVEYTIEPVLADPLLWRLRPKGGAPPATPPGGQRGG